MKKIIRHIAFLIAALPVLSCSDVLEMDEWASTPHIQLDVTVPGVTIGTKATTKPGVADKNENLIKTLDYFIWPDAATNAAPLLSGRIEDIDEQGSDVERIGVNDALVGNLFPGSVRTCTIFVIANLPESVDLPETKTLENLRNLEVTTNFLASNTQSSFVMVFDGKANLQSKRKTIVAKAAVQLKRVAAKFSLDITVASTYLDEATNTTWTSLPSSMRVKLCYCSKHANMSGDPAVVEETDLFSYNTYRSTTQSSSKYICDPFYTYPMEWSHGDETEPYYMVVLPWSNGVEQPNCYYKVLLSGTEIEMNHWQHTNLTLSVLGSFTEARPTLNIPTEHYYVEEWKTSLVSGEGSSGAGGETPSDSTNVNAIIADARYLVMSRNHFVINNLDSIEIPFGSSNECIFGAVYDEDLDGSTGYDEEFTDGDTTKRIYAKVEDFKNGGYKQNILVYDPHAADPSTNWLSINMEDHMIEFNHALQNDTDIKPYDYAPYTITFRIEHRGDAYFHKYYEEVTIIQYPAMYITAQRNSDGTSDAHKGYVYLNNDQTSGNNTPYGGPSGLSGNNSNANMYIITTTVLPANSEFILADPRALEEWGQNDFTWYRSTGWNATTYSSVSAPAVDGGNRTIAHYYPCGMSSEYENVIAPKFRIASSYGKSYNYVYTRAMDRCAVYQEDGYPAGRWRMPTKAEIFYMCQLTTDGIIPRLLGQETGTSATKYWCGSGYVTVYGGDSNNQPEATTVNNPISSSTDCYVRCVYDDWYWEKSAYPTVNRSTFTWGDVAR